LYFVEKIKTSGSVRNQVAGGFQIYPSFSDNSRPFGTEEREAVKRTLKPYDLATLAFAIVLLAVIGILASPLPAVEASNLDPVAAFCALSN
jgi:ABC-type lipoprotein release transport system permease subunit